MSWQPQHYVDLFKLPLTIVVSIIAVAGASKILGLELSSVTIGDVRLEFEEVQRELITSNLTLTEKINSENIQSKEQLDDFFNSDSDQNSSLAVGDKIAQLSYTNIDNKRSNIFESVEGYIWIGNSSLEGEAFTRSMLSEVDSYSDIETGKDYIVKGNMVIRENSPTNNDRYYLGEKQVGLAPVGTVVTILEKPQEKKLERYKQYWAKVKVVR